MDKVLVDRELKPCPFCGGECDATGWLRDDGVRGPECEGCGATAASVEAWNRRAQPAEAEVAVTKIECTTCRGTGSLEFEGGAVVKACAPCKGTGRDLKAERYALAARLAESIAALSAVTAERDRLWEAFGECIQSLHDEMLQSYGGQKPDDMHPVTRRNYDRDMAEIAEYRATMAAKEA